MTVLFADIVGFTPLARSSTGGHVALLDRVFARWDELAARHGLEKIKTIGDAYMVAGGIPLRARTTPRRSPSWRSRWGRSSRAAQRRRRRWRSASASTPAPSSPG